eukprot:6199513-Pleurochrysis_carterae.AAC.1
MSALSCSSPYMSLRFFEKTCAPSICARLSHGPGSKSIMTTEADGLSPFAGQPDVRGPRQPTLTQ